MTCLCVLTVFHCPQCPVKNPNYLLYEIIKQSYKELSQKKYVSVDLCL